MDVQNPSFEVVPLDAKAHNRRDFSCGRDTLDRYIRETARQDVDRDYARVFVMVPVEQPERVAGYYSICSHDVHLEELPADLTARMPRYPTVPALLVGRLAVDTRFQGCGLGKRLLRDAFRRVAEASEGFGVALVVVEALDQEACAFYEKYSFTHVREEAGYPRRMVLPIATLRRAHQL